MKKLLFTVTVMLLVFTGCEKILHEPERSFEILDKEEEKLELINGIYYWLLQAHNGYYFYLFAKSDDITYYTRKHPDCGSGSYGSGDIRIYEELYKSLYKAILNANQLILQLDDEKDALLKGEAHFLRAYCYFKLVRIFKVPPLVTGIDVDYSLPKPTFKEVYDLIESDLNNAMDLLPCSYSEARKPGYSPHKGTVKALLAEVYLTMAGYPLQETKKYALAAELAGQVIDNKISYNLSLVSEFEKLWSSDSTLNSEIIFALFYGEERSFGDHISDINIYNVITNDRYDISSDFHPEYHFYNRYPSNIRKKITFRTGRFIDLEHTFNENDSESEYHTWTIFEEMDPAKDICDHRNYIKYKKWVDEKKLSLAARSLEQPPLTPQLYLFRYAQTLLTYAEASARSGNLNEKSFEAVNKIKRRANGKNPDNPSEYDLPNTLTTEQFIDSVVWERAWELCMEPEGRWFDIIRLDLKNEIIANREEYDEQHEFPESFISDDWYFTLIPEEDRWLNPNFEE
jgi:hypothetical protein